MVTRKKADTAMPAAAETIDLALYIYRMEEDALPDVVVSVSHPDAKEGIHQGRFSGIRLSNGAIGATLSNGEKV